MEFSSKKSSALTIGSYIVGMNYQGQDREKIGLEEKVKDLGVIVGKDRTYETTLETARGKVVKNSWWMLRIFRNRSEKIMSFDAATTIVA